jgi:hypothetical protein
MHGSKHTFHGSKVEDKAYSKHSTKFWQQSAQNV